MACEGVGLILDNVFAVMQRVRIMAILFGFPSFPGCHRRLQWHHICLWPDWQWEVIHHAGSCGSFYTERHNTQSIWTHFWERTGRCVTLWKRPAVRLCDIKKDIHTPGSECWLRSGVRMGTGFRVCCFSSKSWGLCIVRWTALCWLHGLALEMFKDRKSL